MKQTGRPWQPKDSAPEDTEVEVLMSDGSVYRATRVSPPPIKSDLGQRFGGWLVGVPSVEELVGCRAAVSKWRHIE